MAVESFCCLSSPSAPSFVDNILTGGGQGSKSSSSPLSGHPFVNLSPSQPSPITVTIFSGPTATTLSDTSGAPIATNPVPTLPVHHLNTGPLVGGLAGGYYSSPLEHQPSQYFFVIVLILILDNQVKTVKGHEDDTLSVSGCVVVGGPPRTTPPARRTSQQGQNLEETNELPICPSPSRNPTPLVQPIAPPGEFSTNLNQDVNHILDVRDTLPLITVEPVGRTQVSMTRTGVRRVVRRHDDSGIRLGPAADVFDIPPTYTANLTS